MNLLLGNSVSLTVPGTNSVPRNTHTPLRFVGWRPVRTNMWGEVVFRPGEPTPVPWWEAVYV